MAIKLSEKSKEALQEWGKNEEAKKQTVVQWKVESVLRKELENLLNDKQRDGWEVFHVHEAGQWGQGLTPIDNHRIWTVVLKRVVTVEYTVASETQSEKFQREFKEKTGWGLEKDVHPQAR